MKRDVVKRQPAAEFTPTNGGISRNFTIPHRPPPLPLPSETTRQTTSQTGPLWGGKIKGKKCDKMMH